MSAFVCTHETINRVVNARIEYGSPRHISVAPIDADEWGQRMHEMNCRAVSQRYSEPAVPEFQFSHRMQPYSRYEMLKAIDCLIYQCSEGTVPDEPDYAELRQLQSYWRAEIIRHIPQYDQAEWCATDKTAVHYI